MGDRQPGGKASGISWAVAKLVGDEASAFDRLASELQPYPDWPAYVLWWHQTR